MSSYTMRFEKGYISVDAADFGAVADGVTDCAGAFQRACDAAAALISLTDSRPIVVFPPSGTCLIGTAIIVPTGVQIHPVGWTPS